MALEFSNGAIGEVLISSTAYQPKDVNLHSWYESGSILGTQVYRRSGEDRRGGPDRRSGEDRRRPEDGPEDLED